METHTWTDTPHDDARCWCAGSPNKEPPTLFWSSHLFPPPSSHCTSVFMDTFVNLSLSICHSFFHHRSFTWHSVSALWHGRTNRHFFMPPNFFSQCWKYAEREPSFMTMTQPTCSHVWKMCLSQSQQTLSTLKKKNVVLSVLFWTLLYSSRSIKPRLTNWIHKYLNVEMYFTEIGEAHLINGTLCNNST